MAKNIFFEDKRSLAFDNIMTEFNKNKKPADDFDDISLDINKENIDPELDHELDNYNN